MYEVKEPWVAHYFAVLQLSGVLRAQKLFQSEITFAMSQEEQRVCAQSIDHTIRYGMLNEVGVAGCQEFRAFLLRQETTYTLTAEKLLELCTYLFDALHWGDDGYDVAEDIELQQPPLREEEITLARELSCRLVGILEGLCPA